MEIFHTFHSYNHNVKKQSLSIYRVGMIIDLASRASGCLF